MAREAGHRNIRSASGFHPTMMSLASVQKTASRESVAVALPKAASSSGADIRVTVSKEEVGTTIPYVHTLCKEHAELYRARGQPCGCA